MARDDEIERRLLNWARWKDGAGVGGLGYASVNLTSAAGGSNGYREATIPTNSVEAEETDRAVMALDSQLRATVEIVYLGNGTRAEKARRLCCSEATIDARMWKAHRAIAAWLGDKARTADAHRARVETLQKSARP